MRYNHIVIAFIMVFPALSCMDEDIYLHETNDDKIITVPSSNQEPQNKKLWPYAYKMCPSPYQKWSCEDRGACASRLYMSTVACLIGREVGALLRSGDYDSSCSQAHQQMWCSKNMCFPCLCSSCKYKAASIFANSISIITLGSALLGLCVFAPCIKKGSLNCCEKIEDDQVDRNSIELSEKE